jgi:hypothetical protein
MTRDSAKMREFAESFFGRTGDRTRNRVSEERDMLAQARDENTLRLRALRLEKEAAAPAPAKRATKPRPAPKAR